MLLQIKEAKSYFNNFRMGIVKNGHGYSGHKIIKLAVLQDWINKH